MFATVSTVPYRLLGFWGLYLLPLLGSLGILRGVWRIGGLIGLGPSARHAATLLTGLATPVWFYSVLFWEHTVAVALCIGAVYWLLRYAESRTFGALWRGAALAALGVYFRDELYLFCLVYALAAGYVHTRGRLYAAGLPVVLGVAIWTAVTRHYEPKIKLIYVEFVLVGILATLDVIVYGF